MLCFYVTCAFSLIADEEDQVPNFANEDSSENSEDESLDFFGLSNTRSEKAKPSEKPLARYFEMVT